MASALQNDIRDFLKPLCQWIFVTTAGRLPGARKYKLGPKGFPDIMAMTKRGQIMFIEVKGSSDRNRPDQIEFIKWHQEHGHHAIIAHSIDEVISAMHDWGMIA